MSTWIDNLSTDQVDQIEQLQEYVEEYCAAQGIDPSSFISSIDGEISTELLNDPAFMAYWQMAYLQLIFLLSGGSPNVAANGEISYDETAVMQAYNNADSEMLAMAEELLEHDPQLMAFFAMQTGEFEEGDTTNTLLAEIQFAQSNVSTDSSTETDTASEDEYTNTQTREFIEKYGSGDGLDWLIDYEEGIRAAEGNILDYLAEMDQQIADLTEALNGGTMSAEEYQSSMESISSYREIMLTMLQSLESTMANVMEMYSKMIENEQEARMAVINNWRSA